MSLAKKRREQEKNALNSKGRVKFQAELEDD